MTLFLFVVLVFLFARELKFLLAVVLLVWLFHCPARAQTPLDDCRAPACYIVPEPTKSTETPVEILEKSLPLGNPMGSLNTNSYGMTKEEFGAFIEEHVRRALNIAPPQPTILQCQSDGQKVTCK